ncbi:DUF6363 domain-containing protein [Vibrio sp. HB161653]|uniref:Patatin family protein n=1 Tax=Vibrio sp. HB236076 TaxID=3232307 RepID=A0AB39HC48_9VIBR|nr:patatin-like phospholipase family protein [Vibrio sp. HB161653]MDP5253683.1 DUF6363 domain-containing protein [Vibrio sp. HB161653]
MIRTSLITSESSYFEPEQAVGYIRGKKALVTQGGGQRGIFTAGVLDAFLASNFDFFDEFFGTSAGALNLCPYLCRQPGLGRDFIYELTTQNDFFNLFSYTRGSRALGLDWAMKAIQASPYHLNIEQGRRYLGQRHAVAAVTNTATMHDEYLPFLGRDWLSTLIATCAIPKLYPQPVHIADKTYVDGGVSASIPVQEAWRRSARFITVIRTEPCVEASDSNETDDQQVQEGMVYRFLQSQDAWYDKLTSLKSDWQAYLSQQLPFLNQDNKVPRTLNGERWLYGAKDITRLSHLFGGKIDSQLADMLMVHYQTYRLTLDFLNQPPEDCFIVQIAPDQPLKTRSLLSKKDDLYHDYELGLAAGERYLAQVDSVLNKPADYKVDMSHNVSDLNQNSSP